MTYYYISTGKKFGPRRTSTERTAGNRTVKSENCKNRTNGSIIELHVKTAGDLARELRKCTGYMLPSFIYPTISSTKLTIFPVRHTARQNRAGQAINDRTCVHDLVEHGCSVSDKFYRLQHFWYNVVITCFARFSRFLNLIVKSSNRKNLTKYVITTLYQKCCSL